MRGYGFHCQSFWLHVRVHFVDVTEFWVGVALPVERAKVGKR